MRTSLSDLLSECKLIVFCGLMDDPCAIFAMSCVDRDFRQFLQKEGIDRNSAECAYVMSDIVANLTHTVNFIEDDNLCVMTQNNGLEKPYISTCGGYAIRLDRDRNVCEVFRLRIDTLRAMRSPQRTGPQKLLCNQHAYFGEIKIPMSSDLLFNCVDDIRLHEMRRIARLAMHTVCGTVTPEAIAHQANVVAGV